VLDAVEEAVEVIARRLTLERHWTGPMPTPADLAAYAAILPDAPERMMRMAEAHTVDASARDDRLANAEIENAKSGLSYAFLLTLICVIAAIVFFAVRYPIAGYAFLSMPVVMLIRSFFSDITWRR
jgi:uncharacterized membrane protein